MKHLYALGFLKNDHIENRSVKLLSTSFFCYVCVCVRISKSKSLFENCTRNWWNHVPFNQTAARLTSENCKSDLCTAIKSKRAPLKRNVFLTLISWKQVQQSKVVCMYALAYLQCILFWCEHTFNISVGNGGKKKTFNFHCQIVLLSVFGTFQFSIELNEWVKFYM